MLFRLVSRAFVGTLMAGALCSGLFAQAADSESNNDETRTSESDVQGASEAKETPIEIPAYAIGAGDVLSILVWKEPELTTEVTVRQDGQISVPLLGDIPAVGKSPVDLSAELQGLLETYIEAPHVTVSVAQANSGRFFVLGQVNGSGAYPLTGRVTFLQALALAGGFTTFAKRNRILVIRDTGDRPTYVRVDYTKLEQGTGLGKNNFPLRPGDTIVVP